MKNIETAAIRFLREYDGTATLVDDIADSVINNIPAAWLPIVNSTSEERIRLVIKLWKTNLEQELSLTISALESQLKDVFLINRGAEYSLLYVIETEDEMYFYEGVNPTHFKTKNTILSNILELDSKLSWFYNHLHNGWYFLPSQSLGLLPLQDLFTLADKEWDIVEEINISFDLSKTVAFFHNGSGGYLCLNFEKNIPIGILWWRDEEPSINVNFWDYLDEWIKIGLEN
jgi:hypothetical protein